MALEGSGEKGTISWRLWESSRTAERKLKGKERREGLGSDGL